MTRRVLIVTELSRSARSPADNDWKATLDGYEPHDPIGFGPTEGDAVADLYHKITARENEFHHDEQLEADQQERVEYVSELRESKS